MKEYERECMKKVMDLGKFLYMEGDVRLKEFGRSMKVVEANGGEEGGYDMNREGR